MIFETTSYTAKPSTNAGSKPTPRKHPLLRLTLITLLATQAIQGTSWAQTQAAAQTGGAQSQPSQSAAYHYALPVDLAVEAATEAIRVCAEHGYQVTATVVDMDGIAQVAIRGDGASVHTLESSFEKAYTVVTVGVMFNFDTSGALFDLVKTNPYAPRLATLSHVMALPGGAAFKSKNVTVAALGVGGAPGGDKDEVCTLAGIAKVAGRIPN
jgi:uncharacterized protein GlcG (DUF336 family)